MAVRIQDFTIIDVAKPNLGEFRPSRVRADIKIDLVRCVFFLASFLDSSTFIDPFVIHSPVSPFPGLLGTPCRYITP